MSLINSAALRAALDTHRAVRGMSWRELARTLGMSASSFSRTQHGHNLSLEGYVTCCRWLDVPLDTFLTDPQPTGLSTSLAAELVTLLHRHHVPETHWRTLTEHVTALRQPQDGKDAT